jgi:methyltransferase (TIGR00027 family)
VKPGEVSRTARLVAACRALESAGARRICDDPHAHLLAGDEAMAAAAATPLLITGIALRTRFLDEAVREFCAGGQAQVVLVGAGLDARALRLARERIHWFELDLPDMLAHKREVMAAHGLRWPAHAVAVDLATREFANVLLEHPLFDPERRTCIVWEGVSYYLPASAVHATMRQVASLLPAGEAGLFLFDYVSSRWVAAAARKQGEPDVQVVDQVARWGEPLICGFDDLSAALGAHGLEVVENVATEDLLPRYGFPRADKRWYAGRMAAARRAQ